MELRQPGLERAVLGYGSEPVVLDHHEAMALLHVMRNGPPEFLG
jgi:hypothetical protein